MPQKFARWDVSAGRTAAIPTGGNISKHMGEKLQSIPATVQADARPVVLNPCRTPLAKVDTVSLFTGQPVETIYARADGGSAPGDALQWVFNVAVNPRGEIRDLRFWVGEFAQSPKPKVKSLDEGINLILPVSRCEFPAGEVCRVLQVRPITLSKLRRELNGAVRGGGGFYPRAGLVNFLRTRWLGAPGNL